MTYLSHRIASMELDKLSRKKNGSIRFVRSIQWNIFASVRRPSIENWTYLMPQTFDDDELTRIEKAHPRGFTSTEILAAFAEHEILLSEASLRKYVQLGLLPRSVRIGRKGKHMGSQGIYPVGVVRQILRLKAMMAQDYTIEQISREFLFVRSDLQLLEQTLSQIFAKIEHVIKDRKSAGIHLTVSKNVTDARSMSRDLISRLRAIETRLMTARPLKQAAAS